jgi:uncharacterized DUF497 family protein
VITWDEPKRRRNLKKHRFDFVDAEQVFEGVTYTYEDDRLAYAEQRFVTLGLPPRDWGSLHIPAERFNSDHTAFSGLVLIWISANSRRISSTLTDFWLFTELVASV